MELYRCRPPEGIQVPILVTSVAVEDGIPGEDEVVQVVQSLKRVRAGSPSGMRAKDLKGWLREASRETDLVETFRPGTYKAVHSLCSHSSYHRLQAQYKFVRIQAIARTYEP